MIQRRLQTFLFQNPWWLKALVLICVSSNAAWAQRNAFPNQGIPASEAIMIDSNSRITDMQKESLEGSKSQSAVLVSAYNKLLKEELKKANPNRERINRWYMGQAAKILKLDSETKAFFKKQLKVVNPNNPFLYRSKDGKNYLAFPALKNGSMDGHGSVVRVDDYMNSHQTKPNFLNTVKSSANPKSIQFFPREYIRFMAVSYAVSFEMCRVKWSSVKSILSFESAYSKKKLGETKDPLCDEHFIKSLQDPVGWLGFYAFIMANHNVAPRVSNVMFRNLGKIMSNSKVPFLRKQIAFFKFFTNIVAGGLGMTAGLMASDYVHQMKSNPNLKACFRYQQQAGWMGHYCKEAYQDFLLLNTAARDRMKISTMSLLAAFGANTLAQIPLQMAVQGARVGVSAALSLTLGITLGPAGWVIGAVLYVGSTYMFLRFDHMMSPMIEKWYYSHSKPKAVRNSMEELVKVFQDQKDIHWQRPLAKGQRDEDCFRQASIAEDSNCNNPILIDEALKDFAMAMSEHRNLNVLSGVSSTLSTWQKKWSGFYYNYIGSMRLIDLLAYYRRDYKKRLQHVDFMKRYGYDPKKRSSIDIFSDVFNPLYGFEKGLLNSNKATTNIDHHDMVKIVHTWIRQSIAYADNKFKQSIGTSVSYSSHLKPFLLSLLKINDPLILSEKLLQAKQMMYGHNSFYTKEIYSMLHKQFTPIFPYHRSYFGSSNPVDVPMLEKFSNFNKKTQASIKKQRRRLKCSEKGSLEGDGPCALSPEEVLNLEDSYIPMMMNVSLNLGYDIASGERFNFVENIANEKELAYPKLFDPNCYTFNPLGSENPTCWWSRSLKDAKGRAYSARFKTPLFSDYLLANMTCGISNKAYVSTSGGPKNLMGSESYFKSENFSAQFIPPNLIKGAPACKTGKYNFAGRFNSTSDTRSLHKTFIRIDGKEYYGALNAVLDPSNPWIFGDSIPSIENYWNQKIFPAAKNIAQSLYKQYQQVINTQLIPLFSSESRYIDYEHPISGAGQINEFSDMVADKRQWQGHPFAKPYKYDQLSTRRLQKQISTSDLRESFIAQARIYLVLAQDLAGNNKLSDQKLEELLVLMNKYISAMLKAPVDYTLKGKAFIKDMKTKKAYHDNLMKRRNKYMNDKFEKAFQDLGSIEWMNAQDKARFMSQIHSAHLLKDVPKLIAIRITKLFQKNKKQQREPRQEAFGYDDIQLKEALLFYEANPDKILNYLKKVYANYYSDKLNEEQVYSQLLEANEKEQIDLSAASESDLLKEWVLFRIQGDVFGLLGELKSHYLDEWIHGSKFYLNNLQLEQ